ncbi:DNA-binding transcriptional LysR family regulator [Kitasatospora sp. GAS204A]|uniref:LysR family transcriptional regulator n=1 Tax=unclassified Kitasatospora TaxID=2633591 RepID=UPI002476DEA6|nr:LysR family transcriptional regulator [Kitasatospora sp. GAS204B]MDH6116970.1 DNA-binding transcriptional LysR family regulator [Kitasatospora sp. GAS204B]
MPVDLHPRLLRGFLATAETLHFGQAAARLHLAQQALSRDIRTLERLLGRELFSRTTRSVALTEAGERLLPQARRLLALQAEILAPPPRRVVLVDLNSAVTGEDLTADRILAAARAADPQATLLARYHGGLAAGARELLAGRLDVSFGWFSGLPPQSRERLAQRPVRLERVALLLPQDHPLAARSAIRTAELVGHPVDICAGNPATTEWTEFGEHLLAAHGLTAAGVGSYPVGAAETARYLARHGHPMLTTVGGPDLPGVVTRPLVDPVPLTLVSLVYRPEGRAGAAAPDRRTATPDPEVALIASCAAELGEREAWLARPPASWLSAPDEALLAASDQRPAAARR